MLRVLTCTSLYGIMSLVDILRIDTEGDRERVTRDHNTPTLINKECHQKMALQTRSIGMILYGTFTRADIEAGLLLIPVGKEN